MSQTTIALDARLAGGDATGDSTYWTGLLHGLAELSPSQQFLLFSNEERPPGIPETDQFRWVTLKAKNSRTWSLAHFPLAARRMGAKAIHTQYNLSPLCGKRGITTIHDVSFFIGPEWFPAADLTLLKRFVPGSAKRAARVITVSDTSAGEIARFIPGVKDKISVSPLAPHPNLVPIVREKAQAAVREKLKIEGPFVLSVSTRWPRKNMALAIDACEKLPESFPHRLVLTGKPGWGEEKPGKRTLTTGYVDFLTLSALYAAADLYICPSRHEGFGLPIVEAFAGGCPVVCSGAGALPETAGDAAEIVPGWDTTAWAHAIMDCLSDSSKLAAMRERGHRRAARFSWRKAAEIHAQVYAEVAR
ncbi:MAG TPA: glycosyltransferase family 1 protein [Fimbriimonadaceae bacterium]|nr:glycosyltransferase family 1 protein [Fimbriimonadaceae bacterium]